jgi:hypothetical protein
MLETQILPAWIGSGTGGTVVYFSVAGLQTMPNCSDVTSIAE